MNRVKSLKLIYKLVFKDHKYQVEDHKTKVEQSYPIVHYLKLK